MASDNHSAPQNNGLAALRLVDDCFRPDSRDGARLSHRQAINLLQSRLSPIVGSEMVPLALATGRIAAAPVTAGHDIPGHTNSAVDGYAFAASTITMQRDCTFALVGRAAAGHPWPGHVGSGDAVRIFTGAVLPAGTDAVAMQEDCTEDGATVTIPAGLKTGANVRRAGEDVAAGSQLILPGHRLRPQDLAALASSGVGSILCCKPLRVGIASTGDEVVPAGHSAPLKPGQVYDVNRPLLTGLLQAAGAEVVDLGLWPDRRGEVEARLADAAGRCDLILTSGGASQGEEDHISHALAARGQRHFWQIAVKPGRPLMFGQVGSTVVAGLPGNPVAVFVCFLLYVYPMIQRLGGAPWFEPRRYPMRAVFDVPKRKPGRREFWRGTTVATPEGLAVDKFARDGSGLISGLRAADGLIDIPEDRPSVAAGETVDFIPFSEFGFG